VQKLFDFIKKKPPRHRPAGSAGPKPL
jgi:hypothetical protein